MVDMLESLDLCSLPFRNISENSSSSKYNYGDLQYVYLKFVFC